jgi:hypothetical protein
MARTGTTRPKGFAQRNWPAVKAALATERKRRTETQHLLVKAYRLWEKNQKLKRAWKQYTDKLPENTDNQ